MERFEGLGRISHGQDRVLILGSIASVESLAQGYHYAHPSNRFWKVLAEIYQMDVSTLEKKHRLLKEKKIALWDACASCQREGSSDASIRAVVPNDIPAFLDANPSIQTLICNGRTSYQTLKKYYPDLAKQAYACPSTSAANARWSLADLVEAYRKVLDDE